MRPTGADTQQCFDMDRRSRLKVYGIVEAGAYRPLPRTVDMRILEIVPEWPPCVIGGGGQVYRQIALWLGQRHSVTVAHGEYANRRFFARSVRTREGPIELVPLPLVPTPRSAAWLRTTLPPVMPALLTLFGLLSEPWDVAHLHGMCIPMIDIAAEVLRRRHVPYVLTMHGVPASPLRRGYLIRNAFLWYSSKVSSRTVAGAARLTVVSRSLLHDPLIPRREGRVIYNGLSDEDYNGSADHHLPGKVPVVVSLSRLSTNKGIDTAIEAVALLVAQGRDVRYHIYGSDGGDQHMLEHLSGKLGVNDRVHFLGTFEPKDRPHILASADIVVVPSRVEGFGIAALEAVAAGVPVVASRVDGLAEYLHGNSAILVRAGNADDLAAGIAKALDPKMRKRLIESGRVLAEQFHWNHLLGQYEEELGAAASTMR